MDLLNEIIKRDSEEEFHEFVIEYHIKRRKFLIFSKKTIIRISSPQDHDHTADGGSRRFLIRNKKTNKLVFDEHIEDIYLIKAYHVYKDGDPYLINYANLSNARSFNAEAIVIRDFMRTIGNYIEKVHDESKRCAYVYEECYLDTIK